MGGGVNYLVYHAPSSLEVKFQNLGTVRGREFSAISRPLISLESQLWTLGTGGPGHKFLLYRLHLNGRLHFRDYPKFLVCLHFLGHLHFLRLSSFLRPSYFWGNLYFFVCFHVFVCLHFWVCPHSLGNLHFFLRLSSFSKVVFVFGVIFIIYVIFLVWWWVTNHPLDASHNEVASLNETPTVMEATHKGNWPYLL